MLETLPSMWSQRVSCEVPGETRNVSSPLVKMISLGVPTPFLCVALRAGMQLSVVISELRRSSPWNSMRAPYSSVSHSPSRDFVDSWFCALAQAPKTSNTAPTTDANPFIVHLTFVALTIIVNSRVWQSGFRCGTGRIRQFWMSGRQPIPWDYFEREADSPKLLETLKTQSKEWRVWKERTRLQSRCSPS